MNSNNTNETKSDFFSWNTFKFDINFYLSQILKHFNELYN